MSDAFLQELWMQWHLAQQALAAASAGGDTADTLAAQSRVDTLAELAVHNDVDLRLLEGDLATSSVAC